MNLRFPLPPLRAVAAFLAAPAGMVSLFLAAAPASTERDFEQPGSQPHSLVDPLLSSFECFACHGGYDPDVEPYADWAGGMMAQSMRDPVFHAALTIAEQDMPFSGGMCIRCHSPGGWIEGRSTPPDGSALTGQDYDGVNCHSCHRLVDPIPDSANPAADAAILAGLSAPPDDAHGGQYILDPMDRRRGPFDLGASFNWHPWEQSPFHRDSLLCATCHEVSNPALVRVGGATPSASDSYVLGALDTPHPTHDKTDEFPLERTFSEWAMSSFAQGPIDMGGRFGGNLTSVSSCQDCHMPDATGAATSPGFNPVTRNDLPLHTFAGANTWVPRAIGHLDQSLLLYGATEASLLDPALFEDAIRANQDMLAKASDLDLTQSVHDLEVRITNQTGHKLPTGYPEGRRMWIHAQFLDSAGSVVGEHGTYDATTATLDTASTKVYEIKLGLDAAMAAQTGLPEGPSFHLALANKIYFDNRIPPRGFSYSAFESVQAAPVGYAYPDGQYWDDTLFPIPSEAVQVEVQVLHQTTTKEYIEFLLTENSTNQKGQIAYDEWVACGKSKPTPMDTQLLDLAPRYSVNGLTAGGQATLSLEGCTPGTRVTFAYSLVGPGPTQTPWGMVDLSPPIKQTPPAFAGGNGVATLQAPVPPGISGIPVWTQAAGASGGSLVFSNPLALVVQ